MKRFKTLIGLAIGLMLAGSMMSAPALAQPPGDSSGNNTTNVSVTFERTGAFDAYFCVTQGEHNASTSLTVVQPPTLAGNGLATGQLIICYDDTLPDRPAFHVDVQAGAFTGGPSTIPLSGFNVEKTYNVIQNYYGGPSTSNPTKPDYGDIGQFLNGAYVAQNGNPPNPTWPMQWTSNNNLGAGVHLQFGYAGVGTEFSYGQFDVSLVLPVTASGGTYTSTMTLSLYAGENP
jgi:hypothetical protein